LRQIIGDAERLGDVDALARAHHDLGAVYNNRREGHRAIPHLYQAFELYEDAANRLRALSDVGEALKAQGHYGAAEDAFRIALNTGGT
jgi:tetratricopeptide (TPR) repeat protein